MIKQMLLAAALLLCPLFIQTSSAQEEEVPVDSIVAPPVLRFGVINYQQALRSMPEYAGIEQTIKDLEKKFEEETKRSEKEFNERYEAFLDQQQNYAPSILRKRQAELEDMMKRNEQFRVDALLMLEQARKDASQPLRDKLNAVIAQISQEQTLMFVLNSDADAVPFFNTENGIDITNQAIELLK